MNRAHSQPDLAGALRRSRQARAALRSRRRRKVALSVFLAVALCGAGTFSIGEITGNDVVDAAVQRVQSLADMLGQRSPGTRTESELTKTKHARVLAKHVTPAIAPKANMTDLARLLDVAPPALLPVNVAAPPPELAMKPPSLGEIIVPPPAAGPPDTPPPGSSPPGLIVPTPQSKPLVQVPSAVPEPGTWATMLLGFALIGWKLRRNPSLAIKLA